MIEIRQKNHPPEPATLKMYAGLTGALIPLLYLSKPLLSVYGGFKDTVPERLGKFSPALDDLAERRGNRPLVYIHAVSVGEASVAKALVDEIRKRRDDVLIAISTTTFTGRDYILRNFTPDALFFFPLDLPGVMRRLVDKLHPDCFIDIEVELWPNLFRALTDAGVPMALANGRISDRAAHPPAFLRSLYHWLYGSLDALFMRSKEDVERIISLGAPEDRTYLAGNLKFAACGTPPDAAERDKTRSLLGLTDNAKLLVAGSTHPGEDEQIIDAWLDLEKNPPPGTDSIHLVLAPRHLEQVNRIATLVTTKGRRVALWTDVKESGRMPEDTQVVVVDTIGELMRLYGAADAAFVGGSLVTRGGHNVLEPVAMGVPTIHGPSMANFHDLKKVLSNAGLLIEIKDSKELADAVRRCIAEIDRDEYRSRARALIENQQRAADMIADWVAGVLPKA